MQNPRWCEKWSHCALLAGLGITLLVAGSRRQTTLSAETVPVPEAELLLNPQSLRSRVLL